VGAQNVNEQLEDSVRKEFPREGINHQPKIIDPDCGRVLGDMSA
jgi:hypothetical protein